MATIKTKIELQYAEKNISYDDIVKNAKEFWTLELGNKAEDLKSLDLYVKPEENRVYYVANGKETGSFEYEALRICLRTDLIKGEVPPKYPERESGTLIWSFFGATFSLSDFKIVFRTRR